MGALTLTREQLHEVARLLQDAPTTPHFVRQALCRYAAQTGLSLHDAREVHRIARAHTGALPSDEMRDLVMCGTVEEAPSAPTTPPATTASASAPTPAPAPKRRGRRPDGATAATPAERARRWRQAHAIRTVALPGDVAERMREEAKRRELTKARLLAALLEGLR